MGRVVIAPARWQPAADWHPDTAALDVWRVRLAPSAGDWALLSEGELARALRLIVPGKRDQLVAARAALRRILGSYLGEPPERVELDYGEHGKPGLVAGGEAAGQLLQFNLSHSEDVALIGLARGALLGVDVEQRRAERPLERLARRFFSAVEHAQYAALPETQQLVAFYRVWCRKEAYLKAWGTGLTFSSRRFTVELGRSREPWLLSTEMPQDDPAGWFVVDLEPYAGFAAAVCWRDGERTLRLFTVSSEMSSEVSPQANRRARSRP